MTYGRTGNRRGAGAYAKLNLESKVAPASPEQIILLLFEGVENHLKRARLQIESGDFAGKGVSISKSIDIINQGLLSALDYERGGEIAENLAALYDYICRQLIEANRLNSIELLDEARKHLERVSSAWKELVSMRMTG